MKLQPLKPLLPFTVAVAVIFMNPLPSSAYSYAEAEDPMAALFKSAVVAAKDGKWDNVSKMAEKGTGVQKSHVFETDFLAPRFDAAIAEKDVSKTAELFANLVYISIREKLHRNSSENFKDYKNAKGRLQLARKSYLDVLDGNVKKKEPERSAAILKQFDAALAGIGNPGLFGIGKKDPDPDAYGKAVERIESLIVQTFPGFAK
jgi:hypothetical protein